ncbi:diacylglycerol kinase family protein [Cellulomonas sp. Root137]|uniref:diacylglycerol/lipid kinase family protein n=1 Tax=unclassified Cellulomonas TaxID=2620175 RepID=UPI0006F77B22|nr:diacylglycerol kinase family protein [Cellulomonas sp. Root137]KQY46189.1 diacylglycerol kinase [Cellulomonas sp. Root137]KRD43337.1 diacylglycerol kinase [Cellulomonas sp. Root930]
MTWEAWVAVCAAVAALSALLLVLVLWLRQRELRRRIESPRSGANERALRLARDVDETGQQVAFVANPSKQDVPALRAAVQRACEEQGLPAPLWFETTIADPGVGQARKAIAEGADVVVAMGGDGTVRAVAEGLVGTGVPMGLMPLGTGNLLARNLDLPLSDPLAAMRIALEGRDRTIDVGWLRVHRWESESEDDDDPADEVDLPRDHIFLVIAGLGFDAAMVADTDEHLKARVGWIAYFVSGMRHLHGRRTRVHVRLDDQPMTSTRLRSLLIGNCGKLPGGITLLPDALVDDGWLDVAAIDTRGGIAGWAQLFGEVVLQGAGVRNDLPAKIGRIDHTRAQEVRVVVQGGEHVQVDGDIVGRVTELSARVDHAALVVRVAAT